MSDYTLYTYFRSSCSGRLRIAFNLKNLEFKPVYINLLQGEQSSDEHRALNPSCTVPLLICHNDADLRIGQSVPAPEVDEDDMEAVDRETYKAREWDDFKDENRRGAGNTMNMG
ncbi:hypothetical protein NQ176_g6288 [Zarea fungicola]|uniref:Uncharacterized protein n=1 Tax=Zarea fungicola TaxID=93591 RepID=A0ACC1N6D6_9HYPO|nr:hypothetical protein NQ176_g6288 [Lecanicillium fungicola]